MEWKLVHIAVCLDALDNNGLGLPQSLKLILVTVPAARIGCLHALSGA